MSLYGLRNLKHVWGYKRVFCLDHMRVTGRGREREQKQDRQTNPWVQPFNSHDSRAITFLQWDKCKVHQHLPNGRHPDVQHRSMESWNGKVSDLNWQTEQTWNQSSQFIQHLFSCRRQKTWVRSNIQAELATFMLMMNYLSNCLFLLRQWVELENLHNCWSEYLQVLWVNCIWAYLKDRRFTPDVHGSQMIRLCGAIVAFEISTVAVEWISTFMSGRDRVVPPLGPKDMEDKFIHMYHWHQTTKGRRAARCSWRCSPELSDIPFNNMVGFIADDDMKNYRTIT